MGIRRCPLDLPEKYTTKNTILIQDAIMLQK